MAQRGIREFNGKKMLAKYWTEYFDKGFCYPGKIVLVDPGTKLDDLPKKNKWLIDEKLVVKPDQLFGKRGKHGLIKANATFAEAKKWIKERYIIFEFLSPQTKIFSYGSYGQLYVRDHQVLDQAKKELLSYDLIESVKDKSQIYFGDYLTQEFWLRMLAISNRYLFKPALVSVS